MLKYITAFVFSLPSMYPMHYLAKIYWDPDRNLFILPYLQHPVTWYGFLFALGFLFGYFLIRKIFTDFLKDTAKPEAEVKLIAVHLADRLAILTVLGTVIGARLGHVLFYGWPYYKTHPIDIFKIWEGGLASHGGAVGVLAGLLVFLWISKKQFPKFTFLAVLDSLVIPTALVGGCIRIGNFLNQEITGLPTRLPWGVVFMHPVDGIPGVPLHPVQLYESLFYFSVFGFLLLIWLRHKQTIGKGLLSGLFFLLVFGFRYLIEYLKMPQNQIFDTENWIRMGQLLSVPFILVGIFLLVRHFWKSKIAPP